VVKDYITKYSKENDTILDPFCGSGLMGVEAILQNRNFVGYDLNPIAAFLADNTLSIDFNAGEFNREFLSLETELKKRIMSLYALEEGYLLYGIVGKKNGKSYNAVISDFNFQKRKKVTLEKRGLSPEMDFPQGLSYPDRPFPIKFYKDRFSYKGVRNVSDMYSTRNLIALAILFDKITNSNLSNKNLFVLAFTNTLLHTSKLKAENVRPLSVNNFWIPDDNIEENVWWRFADRVNNVRLAKEALLQRVHDNGDKQIGTHRIFNRSSLNMQEISDKTIDYVITDPPYGDAIQYSELSYIWNCWLKKDFNVQDEVIINPVQGKGVSEYIDQMRQSIKEITRVLKKGSFFTLCFHNKDSKIWINLAEVLYEAKLKVVDISSYDTFGYPYNKGWANFSPKSDLYVTFKNKDGLSAGLKHKTLEPEELAQDIYNYLKDRNGGEFDLNKAYDLFIAVIIAEIMGGNKINNYKKLNIKRIVKIFERILDYGNF